MKDKLGMKAVDKLTGYEGIVTGGSFYVTGCDQYLVQPKCESKKLDTYPKPEWFDVNRLEFSEVKKIEIKTDVSKGACGVAPIK